MESIRRPGFIAPMECIPVRSMSMVPRSIGWQYEIKLDGYRCIVVKNGRTVDLYSRRGVKCNQFRALEAAFLQQREQQYVLDGEIVALDNNGCPNFNALQNCWHDDSRVYFYAFDLLSLDGKPMIGRLLSKRLELLSRHIAYNTHIRFSSPLLGGLDIITETMEGFGYEGIVAKDKSSLYKPGKAPGTWLKLKFQFTEEFIVGGYIPSAQGVGELVVGRFMGKRLMYVATIEDGYVPSTRKLALKAMLQFQTAMCPFENLRHRWKERPMEAEKINRVRWVKPVKVVELAMKEWTPDKHLREAIFLRLRDDLEPYQVASYPV